MAQLFSSLLTGPGWGGMQSEPGRMVPDMTEDVPATRIRILQGDAPLGDPCAPRAEMAGLKDGSGKPIVWGPDSGHVVVSTMLRLGEGWTVPSYPGPHGYFSIAPMQVHGSSLTAHPLVAVGCGVLEAGGPVSLGLAVCVGPQPAPGAVISGRYALPTRVWVRVMLELTFGDKGAAALWCALGPDSTSWTRVASYAGPLWQSTNGVVDRAAYLKCGHYMGANAASDVHPPTADLWLAKVGVGDSWAAALS